MEDGLTIMEASAIEMTTAQALNYILPVHCDLVRLTGIVAAVQLALRHPNFIGPTAEYVRAFVDQSIDRVEADGYIATAALMRLGDDPAHDTD